MAYRKHYLVSFGGTLYGTEEWCNNLRMARPLEEPEGDWMEDQAPIQGVDGADDILTDLVGDLRAFFASTNFSTGLELNYVKMNRIGPDGKYLSSSKTHARFLTGTTGANAIIKGQSSANPVPQAAVAVTLRTARQRGVGSRGRIFLPGTVAASQIGTDGRMSTTTVANLLAPTTAFLNSLNNWPGLDANAPRLLVATPGGRSNLEGLNEPVTRCEIGRVVDTQRRRRADLVEDPQGSDLA